MKLIIKHGNDRIVLRAVDVARAAIEVSHPGYPIEAHWPRDTSDVGVTRP